MILLIFKRLPKSFWIIWAGVIALCVGFFIYRYNGDSMLVLKTLDQEILKRQELGQRDRESSLILQELITWRDREWDYYISPIYRVFFAGIFIYPILYFSVYCLLILLKSKFQRID